MNDARDSAEASDGTSFSSVPEQPASPLLELLPHILRTLQREPALAITLIYAFVAMAGIFYNFSFYRRFDIPVLTLSQIGDFLVAGIQQPMALVLVASTFPLCCCSTASTCAAGAGAPRLARGCARCLRRRASSVRGSGSWTGCRDTAGAGTRRCRI